MPKFSGYDMPDAFRFFLELPLEIRLLIYEELLVYEEIPDLELAPAGLSLNRLHPNIIITCRQVYNEARPILWGMNQFRATFLPYHVCAPQLTPRDKGLDLIESFSYGLRRYGPGGREIKRVGIRILLGYLPDSKKTYRCELIAVAQAVCFFSALRNFSTSGLRFAV